MINLLLPDQIRDLQLLAPTIEATVDREAAASALVAGVAEILATHVVLVERRRGAGWRTLAVKGEITEQAIADLMERVTGATAGRAPAAVIGLDALWTAVDLAVEPRRPIWLLLAGDWTLSEPVLRTAAATLAQAVAAVTVRAAALTRRRRAAYVLPRRLARVVDAARLYQMTVDGCARLLDATKVSLAVYGEDEQLLAIAATSGYAPVLVRHLRFRPGVGIIGSVFRTGRSRLVADINRMADAPPPRLRYRTRSFVAVPLVGSAGPLGVLCASDRRDGREFSLDDLAALRALAGVAALVLERVRATELAAAREHDAATDPVTGLGNRRYFHARLQEEVERARREAISLTVIMIDIDNFKEFNDRLGHPAGDALLRAVADVLRRSVRLFDVCARYGGDEFAVLMVGGTGESGAHIADRIREEIQQCRPIGVVSPADLRITVSVGLHSGAATASELLAVADQNLYAAKREGKNRIVLGVPPDSALPFA